ncbi:hypothetical protein QFC21_005445 [Naganishia friedmannii]|uniref:Uncharacterized protein n=1 Tax=Naganishia friedmannii TaxID=89922 RepID=A0ACC2VAF4_9TREE|nr:hypothetical protein QFC21_005445 [Naganishia friedmannii]
MSDVAVEDPCAATVGDSHGNLRIASIFIILVTSLVGTLLPIVLRKSKWVPTAVFEFAKFFGSGVIIATAFMHLLAPAFAALGSECLTGVWQDYDWAPAIAMAAVYFIFFAEIAAYRIGHRKMAKLGLTYHTHMDGEAEHGHDHQHPDVTPHNHGIVEGPSPIPSSPTSNEKSSSYTEAESAVSSLNPQYSTSTAEGVAQLIAVGILEFGVMLHSIIIGLTLGVTDEFIVLFVVLIFHQMFEGLGLGSRLSQLELPKHLRWAPWVAGILYSLMTPIGVAAGYGARQSYNDNGATKNAVSGVLDAFSAGILLYTGLVELLGHEILLNPRTMKASSGKLTYIFLCMLLGSGLMALLARWA